MTPTDIDALARLLDGDPTLNGEATEETRALGQIAYRLSETRTAPARPEFKAALRERLVDAARQPTRAPLLTRLRAGVQAAATRARYSTRMATATAAAALALSGGGMAVAADRAQPSDTLYPAKLVLEDVRIALVRDEVSRGEAHLVQASTRIAEAETAASGGDQAGAAQALVKADQAVRTGAAELLRAYQERGDERSVERLAEFADEQRLRLEAFDGLLDGPAEDAAQALAVALERIEARMMMVTGACPGCAGGVPADGAGFDFAHIPHADEAFEACPCDVGSSGGSGEPVDDGPEPGTDNEPEPPAADEVPPPDADTPEPPAVDPPTAEPPADDAPVPEPDPRDDEPRLDLPDVPEVREPLRDSRDTLIDSVLRGLLDTVLP